MADLISRADAMAYPLSWEHYDKEHGSREFISGVESYREYIEYLPSAQPTIDEREWIPIKYHEITEEEREENGYPKDWVYLFDCEMPSGDQEILVQAKNGEIRWDVCYEEDGFSLDSGWDWVDDIIAWMPLPKPYEEVPNAD